jgi:hypothetical protein
VSCITEILKLKGEQEVFVPADKWIAVEGGGTYKDHEYIIVLNTNGHRCGYVAIPTDHPYSQIPEEQRSFLGSKPSSHWDYDSLDIDVHGGLTFMSPNHGLKDLLPMPCTDMWIGFDCGHYQDKCDIVMFRKYFGEEQCKQKESFFNAMNHDDMGIWQTVKDFSYVEKQCYHIIDQLIQVAV